MGGRAQAPSLVQGLRPRNAPLQNHPSPPSHAVPDTVLHPPHFPSNAPANPHTRASHRLSQESPQITVQSIPPNHSSINPPKSQFNQSPQITVQSIPPNHSSINPPKSQFRQSPQITVQTIPPNHSSDHPPKSQLRHPLTPNPPKPPCARKSQPISKIPPNHSSNNPPKSQFKPNHMTPTGWESEGEGGPLQVCKLRIIRLPTANKQRR